MDTAPLPTVSRADAGGKRRGPPGVIGRPPVAKGELYRWLKLAWPTEETPEERASFPPGATRPSTAASMPAPRLRSTAQTASRSAH
jgi:hypothetical protein